MTTLLEEFQGDVLEMIAEFGGTAILTVPNGAYSTDGTVTETPATYTVQCSDPVDESKRIAQTIGADVRVTCTFYAAASGLVVRPSVGHRLTYQSRTFSVVAAFPYQVQGGIVAWRLDCGEVAIAAEVASG